MASMEEDFPRGGTEKKTTDSKKVKAHEVDNLFETRETVVTKKRKTVQQDGKQKN